MQPIDRKEDHAGARRLKLLVLSDIHGATGPIDAAAALIGGADAVVVAGDLTRTKTRAEAADIVACLERHAARILAVHGNCDRSEVGEYLEEKGYSLHGKGMVLAGIGFFGLGGSSPTPLNTATEYTEEAIAETLRAGYGAAKGASPVVLVSHVPPRGIRDRAFFGLRGGSRSVRAFLEAHRVDLCLCGHIHEAAGVERLGGTLVANAGSFKQGRYLWVELGPGSGAGIDVKPGRVPRG